MSNNKEIPRVLHVLGTTNIGGAESRVMELYRAMDREKLQFDFLIHTDKDGAYSQEIRKLGGNIYSVPRFRLYNFFAYRKAMAQFFSEHHEYIAVHGHMTSTASIYLPIAKKLCKDKLITIAHARSAGVDKGLKGLATRILRMNLKNKADYLFTCSKEAANAVYGKKTVGGGFVWTMPNAIDCDRFAFNEEVRNEVRHELGLEDAFVIGHVGRFSFMKNHAFLVDVFAGICEERNDARLLLIGQGEEMDAIKSKLKGLRILDKVLFLGNRFDVERYYQAFDFFVFPSIFEGFPGSVLEAEAAGLPCLVSDKVTREVALTSLVSYRSVDENPKAWSQAILERATKENARTSGITDIRDKGFDVKLQANMIRTFYETGNNPPGFVTR